MSHDRRASRQESARVSARIGPSTVAGTVGALPLVDHARYRPGRTLPVRVELVRQLRRRRTQVAFALVALLPVILWAAFELGDDGPPGGAHLIDEEEPRRDDGTPEIIVLAAGAGAGASRCRAA